MAAVPVFGARVTCTPSGIVTFNESTDWGAILITFQNCMANNLYTFSSVKLDGVEVNSTASSDNIGPFLAGGAWMGGNHAYGATPSANTVSVARWVDGEELLPRKTINGQVLKIEVVNELFYTDGRKFADEYVTYNVSGNSIEVQCRHDYTYPSRMTIDRYYGMQSMFIGETEILTPGGSCSTWRTLTVTSSGNEVQFTKASAPGFCTYVEHSANGYQASYMYPEDLGLRQWVADNDVVFIGNSWSKCYHKTIGAHSVSAGDHSAWHGIYSWFDKPISDHCRSAADDLTFEYGAYIGGEPVVMSLASDGTMTQTAGIDEVLADTAPVFAFASDGCITVTDEAPCARCHDMAGRLVHVGSGTFACTPGVYVINDMHGHVIKLSVR